MVKHLITRRRLFASGLTAAAGFAAAPRLLTARTHGRPVTVRAGNRLDLAIRLVRDLGGEGEILVHRSDTSFPSARLRVPQGVTLRFERAGRIIVAPDSTLIVAGEVDAGVQQIFDLPDPAAGETVGMIVAAANGRTATVRPEWWPAEPLSLPSGTVSDLTSAINNAIRFFLGAHPNSFLPAGDPQGVPRGTPHPNYNGGTVLFRATRYRCTGKVVLKDNVALEGQGVRAYGARGSVIMYVGLAANSDLPAFVEMEPPATAIYQNCRISNLSILGDSSWKVEEAPGCDGTTPPGSAKAVHTPGKAAIGLLLNACCAELRGVYVNGFGETALEIRGGANSIYERVRAGAAPVCLKIDGAESTTQLFTACWFEGATSALVQISAPCSTIWFGGGTIFQASDGEGVVLADRVDGQAGVGTTYNATFDTCYWENVRGTYLRAGTAAVADPYADSAPRVLSMRVTNPTFRPNNSCRGFTEWSASHRVYDLDKVGWAHVEVPFIQNHERTLLNATAATMRVVYFTPVFMGPCTEFGPDVDGFVKRRIFRFCYPHTGPNWDPRCPPEVGAGAGTLSDLARLDANELRADKLQQSGIGGFNQLP